MSAETVGKAILLRSLHLSLAEIGRVLGVRPETLQRILLRIGTQRESLNNPWFRFLSRRYPAFQNYLSDFWEELAVSAGSEPIRTAMGITRCRLESRFSVAENSNKERLREAAKKRARERRKIERMTARVLKRGPVRISLRGIISFLSECGSRGRREGG